MLNLKMDVVFSSILRTTSSINRFYATSRQASLLKKVSTIRLLFNDSFHFATISNISQSKQKDTYEISIIETFPDILPGSTVPVKIIYKTKKLYEEIFGKIL